MASDLSSNCTDAIEMLDEKEEGEISLEDVSSSDEGHVNYECTPKTAESCPRCRSSKNCTNWCTFATRTTHLKNYLERDAVQEKENRRLSKESGCTGMKHAASSTLLERNDELIPISSDSDMEIVGLAGCAKQTYRSKSPRRRKKKRKRIHSSVLRVKEFESSETPAEDNIVEIVDDVKLNYTGNKEERYLRARHREQDVTHSRCCCSGTCRSGTGVSPSKRHVSPSTKVRAKQKKSRSPVLCSRSPTNGKNSKRSKTPVKMSYRPSVRSPCRNDKTRDSSYGRAYTQRLLQKLKRLDKSGIQKSAENTQATKGGKSSLKDKLNNLINKSSTPNTNTRDKENNSDIKNSQNNENDEEDDVARLRQIALETKLKKMNKSLESRQAESDRANRKESRAEVNRNVENNDEDDEEDLKLRLIVLRSAFLRKHRERKQRGIVSKCAKARANSPFDETFLENLSILKEDGENEESATVEPQVPQESANPEDMDLDTDIEREKEKDDSPYSPSDEVNNRLSIERELLGMNSTDVSFISCSYDKSSSRCDNKASTQRSNVDTFAKSVCHSDRNYGSDSYHQSIVQSSAISSVNYDHSPSSPSPLSSPFSSNCYAYETQQKDTNLKSMGDTRSELFSTNTTPENIEVPRAAGKTDLLGENGNFASCSILMEDKRSSGDDCKNQLQKPLSPPPAPPDVCIVANMMCATVASELCETDLDGSPLVLIDGEQQSANVDIAGKPDWPSKTSLHSSVPMGENSLSNLYNENCTARKQVNDGQNSREQCLDETEERVFRMAEMKPVNVNCDGVRSSVPFKPIKITSVSKKQIPVSNLVVAFGDVSDVFSTDGNIRLNTANEDEDSEGGQVDKSVKEIGKKILTEDSDDSNLVDKKGKTVTGDLPKSNADDFQDTTGKRKLEIEEENTNTTETSVLSQPPSKILKVEEKRKLNECQWYCDQDREERFRNTDGKNQRGRIGRLDGAVDKSVKDDAKSRLGRSPSKTSDSVTKSDSNSTLDGAKDESRSQAERRASVDEDEEALREMLLASIGKREKPLELSSQPIQSKRMQVQSVGAKPSEVNIHVVDAEKVITKEGTNSNPDASTKVTSECKQATPGTKKPTNLRSNVMSKGSVGQANDAAPDTTVAKFSNFETTKKRLNLSASVDNNTVRKIVKRSSYAAPTKVANNAKRFQNSLGQLKLGMSVTFSTQKLTNSSILRKVNINEKTEPSSPSASSLLPDNQRFIISLHSDTESDSESEKQQSSNVTGANQGSVEQRRPVLNIPTTEFERSVDQFLREVRKKQELAANNKLPPIPSHSKPTQLGNALPKKIVTLKVKQNESGTSSVLPATPLAVRHLSASQQEEYRRLKQRILNHEKMKMQKTKRKCAQPSSDATTNTSIASTVGSNMSGITQKSAEKHSPPSCANTNATMLNTVDKDNGKPTPKSIESSISGASDSSTVDNKLAKTLITNNRVSKIVDASKKLSVGEKLAKDIDVLKTMAIGIDLDDQKTIREAKELSIVVDNANASRIVDESSKASEGEIVGKDVRTATEAANSVDDASARTVNRSPKTATSKLSDVEEDSPAKKRSLTTDTGEMVEKICDRYKCISERVPGCTLDVTSKETNVDKAFQSMPACRNAENVSNDTSKEGNASARKPENGTAREEKKATLKILTMEEVNSKFANSAASVTQTTDQTMARQRAVRETRIVDKTDNIDKSCGHCARNRENVTSSTLPRNKGADAAVVPTDVPLTKEESQARRTEKLVSSQKPANGEIPLDTRSSTDRAGECHRKVIQRELQHVANMSSSEQKQYLASVEHKLVTKRYKVLSDLSEMATTLRQWETEREVQMQLSSEVKKLREQLRLAEERLKEQKKRLGDMGPSMTTSHERINHGRRECNRLSRVCTGLGYRIYGSNYKIPAAGAQHLSNKLREVADHTKKLSSQKVSVQPRSLTERVASHDKENSEKSATSVLNPYANVSARRKVNQTRDAEVTVVNDNVSVATRTEDESRNSREEEKTDDSRAKAAASRISGKSLLYNVRETNDNAERHNSETTASVEDETITNASDAYRNNVTSADETVAGSPANRNTQLSTENGTFSSKRTLKPYESILTHLRTTRMAKFNGILCPYELMGTCNDSECRFLHHSPKHCQ